MRLTDVLRSKGNEVHTIRASTTIAEVVDELARLGVGALVVTGDGNAIEGILSERDIVRCLAAEGASTLERTAGDLMTTEVQTCGPDEALDDTLTRMTQNRFRHLPVVEHGQLCGIVSIGDVVKRRLDELEAERGQLHAYISGR